MNGKMVIRRYLAVFIHSHLRNYPQIIASLLAGLIYRLRRPLRASLVLEGVSLWSIYLSPCTAAPDDETAAVASMGSRST